MTKFTIIDLEAVWDENLHEAYRDIDPVTAGALQRGGHHRHRQPCKRVIAAAAFDIELHPGGAISIGGLTSWTAHTHGDEREVVACLFEHLRARPLTHVVTYAGLAAEVPLLTLAAMEYGILLPPQFAASKAGPVHADMWRKHIDLALELKGKGRDWAHMSEIGLRVGLPGALFAGKADIEQPRSNEDWLTMRQRVSMDCITTAIIAFAFWRACGRITLDQAAMIHNIADWCLRHLELAETHVEPLIGLRAQMIARMGAELEEVL